MTKPKPFKTLLTLIGMGILLISCSKENNRTCTQCNSPQTAAFELCEESDGTASVNGENTGVDYNVYISGLEAAGATCGN